MKKNSRRRKQTGKQKIQNLPLSRISRLSSLKSTRWIK